MCFAFSRHELLPYLANKETKSGRKRMENSRQPFLLDFVSASVATAASSPFNYVRNVHYAVPSGQTAESHVKILTDLYRETARQSTLRARWDLVSTRLRIGTTCEPRPTPPLVSVHPFTRLKNTRCQGWGTLRVGCGMGLASQIYSVLKSYMF
jgi:hypothetical protein